MCSDEKEGIPNCHIGNSPLDSTSDRALAKHPVANKKRSAANTLSGYATETLELVDSPRQGCFDQFSLNVNQCPEGHSFQEGAPS